MSTDNTKIEAKNMKAIEIIKVFEHFGNFLTFKPVEDDPDGFLSSKPLVDQTLIRYLWIDADDQLHMDGEVLTDTTDFYYEVESVMELKKYWDDIEDWDNDWSDYFSRSDALTLETLFFSDPNVKQVFPVAAFVYDEDGYIFESDFTESNGYSESSNVTNIVTDIIDDEDEDLDDLIFVDSDYYTLMTP